MQYNQGDIVVVNFPFSNLTNSKKRPALIISNNTVNSTGDYLLVQITSKKIKDSLTFPLKRNSYVEEHELPLKSYIRLHKVFLLNQGLIIGKATELKADVVVSVVSEIVKLLK
jgi:mRNA interferase MazF